MTTRAVVSLLWERHLGALDHFLAGEPGMVVITPAGAVSDRLRAIAAARGASVVALESLLPPGYNSVQDATAIVASLHACLEAPGGWWESAGLEREHEVRRIIADRVDEDVHPVVQLMRCLAHAHSVYDVVLYVTSEDVTAYGRAAAQWARAHDVPSLHLAHSLALVDPYTVHAHLETDVLAVYGQRGAEGYLDLGIEPARIVVTGNPAWDGHRELRATRQAVRREIQKRYGLDDNLPVVVFGTTWSAHLTAFDPGDTHASTLGAFVAACEDLAGRGIQINAVVKDRPANAELGQRLLDDLLRKVGEPRQTYTYATGDTEAFAAAADILVAVDSNYLVEAMLVGTVGVNLIAPSALPAPPAFDAGAGIVEVEADELADHLAQLLGDPAARAARLERAAARATYFNATADDGRAAQNVGRLMTALARREPVDDARPGSPVAHLARRAIRTARASLGRWRS